MWKRYQTSRTNNNNNDDEYYRRFNIISGLFVSRSFARLNDSTLIIYFITDLFGWNTPTTTGTNAYTWTLAHSRHKHTQAKKKWANEREGETETEISCCRRVDNDDNEWLNVVVRSVCPDIKCCWNWNRSPGYHCVDKWVCVWLGMRFYLFPRSLHRNAPKSREVTYCR